MRKSVSRCMRTARRSERAGHMVVSSLQPGTAAAFVGLLAKHVAFSPTAQPTDRPSSHTYTLVHPQSYSTPEALEQAREAVRQELVYRELAKQRYDSLMDPTQKHRSLLASARMHPAGPGEGLPVTEGAKLVDDQQHTANGADVRQSTTTITTTTTAMMITNDAESNKPSTGEPSSYGNEEEDDDDEDEGEIEELNGESREPHARSQPSNASSSGSAPAAGYAFPPPLKPRFTVPNIPWTVDETVLLVNLVKQYAENWDEIVKDERYVEVFASRRKLRSLKLRWRFAKRHGWVNKAGEYVGPTEYAASEKNVVAARKRQREMELRHYQSTVVPQEYITTKATALPLHNLVVDALHETDSRALLQPGVPMLQLPVLPPEQAAGSSALPHLPSTSAPLAAHALHHPLLAATSSHAQQLSAHSSFMSSSAQSVKLKTVTGQYSSAAAMSSPTLSGPPLKKPSLSSSNTTSVPRADSSQPLLLSTGTQTQLQYVKLEPHVQPLPTMSTLGHAPAMPPPIMPSPVPPLEHLQRQPLLPPSGLAQVQFNLQLLAKAQAALRQRQLVPRQGLPMPPPPPSSAASSLPHLAHLQEHEI